MADCYTCELVAKRDSGEAPLWDSIVRTDHWDLCHAYNTRLLGWMVLVSRRHLTALHEMNSAEAAELGTLMHQTSVALQHAVGCTKTYVMQFAEHPLHPHVHFHVVPRMPDQPAELNSTRVFGYMTDDLSERVSEAEMNRVSAEIRNHLQDGLDSTE